MRKHKATLAAVIPLALAGCWAQGPGMPAARSFDMSNLGLGEQVIDLSGGKAPALGYGKLTLRVPISNATRNIQAAADLLVVVVTKKDGTELTDEDGNKAVYKASVSGGIAKVTLPGLPATTTSTAGGMDPATAYVITTLMGNWLAGDVPSIPGADGYNEIEAVDDTWTGYGSNAGGPFVFDLGSNLVAYDTGTPAANGLISSGYGRADISPGLQSTVDITSWIHMQKRHLETGVNSLNFGDLTDLDTSAEGQKAVKNVITTTIKSDASGNIKMRMPGVLTSNFAEIRAAGAGTGVRTLRIVASTNGGGALGTPNAAVTEWEQDGDVLPLLGSGAMSTQIAAGNNSAFTLNGKIAWRDVNLASAITTKRNIDISLSGLPQNTNIDVSTIPLGVQWIMTGETDTAGNKFN
ncbi:MAG: hypothetical protein FJZ01_08120 [Candidatus Sericytochromatia bacterium]|nr:hypothetical protein [Candidatus Tanganyikabacteria bacterium]